MLPFIISMRLKDWEFVLVIQLLLKKQEILFQELSEFWISFELVKKRKCDNQKIVQFAIAKYRSMVWLLEILKKVWLLFVVIINAMPKNWKISFTLFPKKLSILMVWEKRLWNNCLMKA